MRTVTATSARPYKFAHVVIRTRQLQAMRDHYVKILNAEVVTESEVHCGMTYDEEHHRLALVALPPIEETPLPETTGGMGASLLNQNAETDLSGLEFPTTTGVDHLAYTYSNLGELLGTYVRLRDDGITPQFCINHGITLGFYYVDPDGIKNELQIDTMTVEQADEYLRSPEGLANVIGFPFDPEDLLARYESGAPVRDLVLNIGKPEPAAVH